MHKLHTNCFLSIPAPSVNKDMFVSLLVDIVVCVFVWIFRPTEFAFLTNMWETEVSSHKEQY